MYHSCQVEFNAEEVVEVLVGVAEEDEGCLRVWVE